MAGPLTWRNVDAPSFAGSFDGLRTASTLLNNATRAGMDLTAGYTQARSDAADRAILQRSLALQNSGDFRDGLVDGSVVGSEGANASLETLRGLDNRTGTLLNRDVTRQNFEQTGYTNERGRAADTRLDAASPVLNRIALAARNGDAAGVNVGLQDPSVMGLDAGQFRGSVNNADSLTSGYQGRRGTEWNFGNSVKDREDSELATGVVQRIIDQSLSTGDAEAGVTELSRNLTPRQRAMVENGLRGRGFNVFGPGAAPGAGAAPQGGQAPAVGGTAPSAPGSGGASVPALGIMTGGAQLPDTVRTIGDMVDNKSSLLRTNPRGTATGLYQITSDTWAEFGPKVLGDDWRNADIRNPQVQDRVAEGIWEQAKNSPSRIQGRWASVNAQEAAAMRGKPWAEVRDILSQKESSTIASQVLNAPATPTASAAPADVVTDRITRATDRAVTNQVADQTSRQMVTRAGQNQANETFMQLENLQGDQRDASKAVDDILLSENGPYRGSDKAQLVDHVNWLTRNSDRNLTPAQAATMLQYNVASSGPQWIRDIQAPFSAAADIALGTVPRLAYRGLTAVADGLGAGGVIPDGIRNFQGRQIETAPLANGLRINDEGVYNMLDQYNNGGSLTAAEGQRTIATENAMLTAAQQAYNAAEQQLAMYTAQAQAGRPGVARHLARVQQQRDQAYEALRRVTQSGLSQDTLRPRNQPVARTQGSGG